ncbi:MAG: CPBP family intramembrane glutamic endopeptidase [Rhodothermales bacterium]
MPDSSPSPSSTPGPAWLDRLPLRPGRREYVALSRTATYSFLAALPLLVGYHVLILVANAGSGPVQVRVGAEVWITRLLAWFGATGMLALGVAVLVAGLVVFVAERKKDIPIRRRYFGWMVAESLVYAVVLAALVGYVVGVLFAVAPDVMAAQVGQPGRFMMLALSLGAGIYEELVFRVFLVGGLFAALHRLTPWTRGRAYVVAALVGALVFSAVHYIGPLGDPFALPSFTFRFLFGLALNAVFLVRGFGIAAWTHALYDVLVVTLVQ